MARSDEDKQHPSWGMFMPTPQPRKPSMPSRPPEMGRTPPPKAPPPMSGPSKPTQPEQRPNNPQPGGNFKADEEFWAQKNFEENRRMQQAPGGGRGGDYSMPMPPPANPGKVFAPKPGSGGSVSPGGGGSTPGMNQPKPGGGSAPPAKRPPGMSPDMDYIASKPAVGKVSKRPAV